MTIAQKTLETSHGKIAVRETGGKGTAVLLVHGNSSSSAVFRNQLESPLGERYRIIAADLPGHGASGDAIDPDRSYSMEGYADAMTEVLGLLGVSKAIVFGWSLGGHIGLEMIDRFPGLLGLMITGTRRWRLRKSATASSRARICTLPGRRPLAPPMSRPMRAAPAASRSSRSSSTRSRAPTDGRDA